MATDPRPVRTGALHRDLAAALRRLSIRHVRGTKADGVSVWVPALRKYVRWTICDLCGVAEPGCEVDLIAHGASCLLGEARRAGLIDRPTMSYGLYDAIADRVEGGRGGEQHAAGGAPVGDPETNRPGA